MNLQELRKGAINIDRLSIESTELDKILIDYINGFCFYDEFSEAEGLVAKLSPGRISDGEKIIKNYKKDSSSFKEEYLKYAEKQYKNNKSEGWDFNMKKQQIKHDINKQRKDDFYELLQQEKALRNERKKVKVKGRVVKKNEVAQVNKDTTPERKQKKERTPILQRKEPSYNFAPFEIDGKIVIRWHKEGRKLIYKKKRVYEGFMFLWISFNALYEATTIATHDSDAWKEFIKKEKTKEMWNSVKNSPEIERFLEYLKDRKVYDKSGNEVQTGGLYDMKHDAPYKNWDFGDDLQKYIGVIYRIRNNLFHGGKTGDDSDINLIQMASESFRIFLDKLYGFSN